MRLGGTGPLEDPLEEEASEAAERDLPAIVGRAETSRERGHYPQGILGEPRYLSLVRIRGGPLSNKEQRKSFG